MGPFIGKLETQNQRLGQTGQAKPAKTYGLMGTVVGFARQEAAESVSGGVMNRSNRVLQSKPGQLAGYVDPSVTLLEMLSTVLLEAHVLAQCLDYPTSKTKNCWPSIDDHFYDEVVHSANTALSEKTVTTS